MLRGVNTFRDYAFSSDDGISIGFHILRFLIQEPHHYGTQENEGQQRDRSEDGDLPGDAVDAQASGKSREGGADSEADGTETRCADFNNHQNDGDNKPNLIDMHSFKCFSSAKIIKFQIQKKGCNVATFQIIKST